LGKTICVDFDYRFTNLENMDTAGTWCGVHESVWMCSSSRKLDVSEANVWKHCELEVTADNYFIILIRGKDSTGLSVVMNVKNLSIIEKSSISITSNIKKTGAVETSIIKEGSCDITISQDNIRANQIIEI